MTITRQLLRRLLTRLLRTVHLPRLHLHAHIGFDDPADTGRLWGVIGPVVAHLPARLDTDIRPAFDEPVLTFHSRGTVRVSPLRVIAVLLTVLLSPTAWRALRPALSRR